MHHVNLVRGPHALFDDGALLKGEASAALLRLHDFVANGVPHQGSRRGKMELAHNSRAMRLHSLEGYNEKQRDLLVRMAFGDQLHHFSLSISKYRSRSARALKNV